MSRKDADGLEWYFNAFPIISVGASMVTFSMSVVCLNDKDLRIGKAVFAYINMYITPVSNWILALVVSSMLTASCFICWIFASFYGISIVSYAFSNIVWLTQLSKIR